MPERDAIPAAIENGELDRAEKLIEAALTKEPEDPVLLAWRGQLKHKSGAYGEAVEDFLAALGREPKRAEWQNALGKSLNNLQRIEQAESAFREAIAAQPNYAEAWHNLGHALRAQRKNADALAAFVKARDVDPAYAAAWHNAGLVCLIMDDPQAALSNFESAARVDAKLPRLWVHTGVALHHLGRYEESITAYRRALAFEPADAEALNNLAISLQDAGHDKEALATYRDASEAAPGDLQIRTRIADLLISLGQASAAMDIANECLRIKPGMTSALAVAAVAGQERGSNLPDTRLLDFHRLILHEEITPPAGDDLAEYNQSLSVHVVAHPTLAWEPPGHATRKGSHTGNLLLGDKGPVAHLETQLHQAVERYADQMAENEYQFMLDGMPDSWRLTMWSVVMESQGHQLPHIHPAAWLSGVYYAQIPGEIDADDAHRAGWIEFGTPPATLNCQATHATTCFHPKAGEFYLFPAYFYHRTVPFRSDQRRICLAFDVIPE